MDQLDQADAKLKALGHLNSLVTKGLSVVVVAGLVVWSFYYCFFRKDRD